MIGRQPESGYHKIFFGLVHDVVAKYGRNVPYQEVHLTFVKSEYLIGRSIPTIQNEMLLWKKSISQSQLKN